MATPKPWERQPREGSLAFAAFTKYLELGPDRTLADVALDPALGITETKARSLSATWKWRDRVNAWEDYLAEAQRKRQQKILETDAEKWARRRLQLREDEYTTAERLIRRANEILDLDIVEKQIKESVTIINQRGEEVTIPTLTIIKPVRTSTKDAAAALNTGSQISRLSAEMETSRDRLDVNVSDDEKKIELARAALKQIRDEMVEKLIRDHPELVPKVLERMTAWVAEKFGLQPEQLEESKENGHEPQTDNSKLLAAPIVTEPASDNGLPVIDAEYVPSTSVQ